jgi:hypothetical protein
MIKRYNAGRLYAGEDEMVEFNGGDYVKYEDYLALKATIDARTVTDCLMPPRIEDIRLRSPLEVEDMWMHRVKWLCAELGVKVHE